MAGRSCSLARTVFFIAERLRVTEVPDRVVVDRQAALRKLGHQPAQGEVAGPASLDQPVTMLPRDLPRLVAAHLAGRDAPSAPEARQPANSRTHRHAEMGRRLMPRHPVAFNRGHNTLA